MKACDDLRDFNRDFEDDEYQDIRHIRSEFDNRTWTEIVLDNKHKYGDLLHLAKLLDRKREVKYQDVKNKQALLYHGKKLINKLEQMK